MKILYSYYKIYINLFQIILYAKSYVFSSSPGSPVKLTALETCSVASFSDNREQSGQAKRHKVSETPIGSHGVQL